MSAPGLDTPVVLAVDDDRDILRILVHTFADTGIELATVDSAAASFEWISRHGLPSLAVVDIQMPQVSGLDLARRLHAFCDVPILFLTVITDLETTVRAIEDHGEDYLTKPFRPAEMVARVRRVLLRFPCDARARAPATRIDAHLTLHFSAQEAELDGRVERLTPLETKLLHVLVRAGGRVVSTPQLLRRLWPGEEVFEDALRVHVHRLRQKIEPDPARPIYLLTHRGAGYAFGAG